jgi:hypothetical protein
MSNDKLTTESAKIDEKPVSDKKAKPVPEISKKEEVKVEPAKVESKSSQCSCGCEQKIKALFDALCTASPSLARSFQTQDFKL